MFLLSYFEVGPADVIPPNNVLQGERGENIGHQKIF
jgi:hypothetical protein